MINNCKHNFKIIEDYLGEGIFRNFKLFILKCENCGSMKSERMPIPKNISEVTVGSRKRLKLENDYFVNEIKKIQEVKKNDK